MTVTMRDVARTAAVSIKTVSRVVNQEGEISADTRKRVLAVIDALGYRPNLVARGLVSRKTGIIGLVIPDITNPFFAEMTRGVQDMVRASGRNLMICSADEAVDIEVNSLHSLVAQSVDGIIVFGSMVSDLTLPAFAQSINGRMPLVTINNITEHEAISRIMLKNLDGAAQVMRHLLARGHTRIGMLAPVTVSSYVPRRLRGYRDALQDAGVHADPAWVRFSPPTITDGYRSALELLLEHRELTALFCYNDLMAIGAMRACADLGLRVPLDLAIAGYDDIQLAEVVTPALTTVRVDKIALGRRAVQHLLNRIQSPDAIAHDEEIDVTLVEREST
jgi:LacI family transcriptional regulator